MIELMKRLTPTGWLCLITLTMIAVASVVGLGYVVVLFVNPLEVYNMDWYYYVLAAVYAVGVIVTFCLLRSEVISLFEKLMFSLFWPFPALLYVIVRSLKM